MRRTLIILFVFASLLACISTPTPVPPTEEPPLPPPDNGSSGGSGSDSGGGQPTGQPDLTFISLSGDTDATGAWIVAEIANNGSALADGFWVTCDYTCPVEGTSYSGIGIVSGGYIPAGNQQTYRAPFTAACDPKPSSVSVSCEIGGIAESNPGNNFATAMIPTP
jgi:hypothetical protein